MARDQKAAKGTKSVTKAQKPKDYVATPVVGVPEQWEVEVVGAAIPEPEPVGDHALTLQAPPVPTAVCIYRTGDPLVTLVNPTKHDLTVPINDIPQTVPAKGRLIHVPKGVAYKMKRYEPVLEVEAEEQPGELRP